MILNVILISIVGGILFLDRVVLHVMISRPIIAAPLKSAQLIGHLSLALIALAILLVPVFCAVFLIATTITGFIRSS